MGLMDDKGAERKAVRQDTSITYQLNLGDVIERIRKFLEGYYYDEKEEAWKAIKEDEEGEAIPIMNDEGISMVMEPLISLQHRGTLLGNISQSEAEEWSKRIHKKIAGTLFVNMDKIDLQPSKLGLVSQIIGMNIYIALTRAVKGETADKINKIVEVSEHKGLDQTTGQRLLPKGGA